MTAIFEAHMRAPDSIAGLADAVMSAQGATLCLLCFEHAAHECHRSIFEHAAHECHRSILARMIRTQTGQDIRHL